MQVREATPQDAPGIAQVHVDSWRTTYRGIVPPDYLASLSASERAERWTEQMSDASRGTLVFVGEDEAGQVVGFAAGGPARGDGTYDAELYAIYLLEAYQRQGLGRRLTTSLVQGLAARDMRSLVVWVLAGNPARHFYEALGGSRVAERTIDIGGMSLVELAYGWPDLHAIIAIPSA